MPEQGPPREKIPYRTFGDGEQVGYDSAKRDAEGPREAKPASEFYSVPPYVKDRMEAAAEMEEQPQKPIAKD